MMASKLPCVIPICHEGGFGPWFDLDWTGRPNHSMAARHGTYTHVKYGTVRLGTARCETWDVDRYAY
ncbi:hypothetical protein TIFTF001_051510 [Ficus carica]|uniref:Uncharacterized protein n=1 Tax=Ficus carica TaxID=3494 RepID=A0AA88CR61_FICCA|nr:hypothetical protein TIFTF001_051510 [Ficus carica]